MPSSVSTLLNAHTSIRTYNQRQLTRDEVVDLVQTAQMAATSNFRQCYSIVWVTDAEKRKQLGLAAVNEEQYNTCGAAFVVCVDFNRLKACSDKHNLPCVAGTAENLLIGCVDASLFAQNLAVAAEGKGMGICYIGGVRTNITDVDAILNLPDLVFPLFGLTIGEYDVTPNETKPRLPVEAVLHENTFNADKYAEILETYDHTLSDYYANRLKNPKSTTYTKDMAASLITNKRPHIKKYLESKGFTFN